jgi:TPR repeat protein
MFAGSSCELGEAYIAFHRHSGDIVINYAALDVPIDQLIWQHIADSPCPEDFRAYLRHAPEGAAHLDEAIERLIALDDADAACADEQVRYPVAIAAIEQLADAGDAVAQFHLGKLHDNGIGIPANRDRAEGWYRVASLQGEPRSHVNRALRLDDQGDPENIAEARRLCGDAAATGEGTATFHLARMISCGRGEESGKPDPVRAFELFHQAWEQGCAVAGHWIGYMLQRGDGVRLDTALGREWVERAAQAGCSGAIIQLGTDAEAGKDIPAARTWFQLGAEQGDMECQHRLASLLLAGKDIPKDGAQAVHWLKRAAVRGDANAQRILGLTYLWGIDVIRNERFGRKWLTRAAEQGDAHAAYHLGKVCQRAEPPEPETAVEWFERAAKTGHSEAQGALGLCYWSGRGVHADPHSAFKWIRLCALQGDPWGLCLLGRLYWSGVGVPVDCQRAAQNFRLSAERGHPSGQAKLGWCYLNGEGVERDVAEGMLWLTRAAEQGDAEASTTIGYVLRDGIGVERNSGEASKWFLDAAEKGDARGQFELGMLYAEGSGLERNLLEARKWMEKAAAQGEEDAVKWLTANDVPEKGGQQ